MSKTQIKKKSGSKKRLQSKGQGSIYKRRGGTGSWRMAYMDFDGTRVDLSTGTKDKKLAHQILAKKINQRQEIAWGLTTPQDRRLIAAGDKQIRQHIDEYIDFCQNKKQIPESIQGVNQKRINLMNWIEYEKINFLSEITEVGLTNFLNFRQQQRSGRSGHTQIGARSWNFVRSQVFAFINWCVKQHRLNANPFRNVVIKNTDLDKRRERRAFTGDEIKSLICVAKTLGRDAWYLCALDAGLRKGDIKALIWSNVQFLADGEVNIRVVDQKSKSRLDIIPVGSRLGNVLRKRFKDMSPAMNDKVFPKVVTDRTRDLDFKRAGIEKVDSFGRVVDLHAARKTLATSLVGCNASSGMTQSLLRHADLATTMTYYNDKNSLIAITSKRKALEEAIRHRDIS